MIKNYSTKEVTFEVLLQNAEQHTAALQYLRSRALEIKEGFQIDIHKFWYVIKNISDLPFLHELLTWFPNGTLGNNCLKHLLIKLINQQTDDWSLYQKIGIFHEDDSKTEYLNEILCLAIERNLFNLIIILISSNKISLEYNTIWYILRAKNKKAADLLFQHGLLDVNRTLEDHISIGERCLTLSLETKEERDSQQEIIEMLQAYRVDWNIPIIKENPPGHTINLLAYLVFRSLNIPNNPDFHALQLQKFTALFFDFPGTSMSNNTLCVHPYMIDVFAHWNFVLNLYLNELQNMPRIPSFDDHIRSLYSADGTYDTALSYRRYQNGNCIVFPVHLRGCIGEAHVATIGFMKIAGTNKHLRVEADRGMGRRDFTVFKEPAFRTKEALKVYTHTLNRRISIEEWHADSFDKTKILSIEIGKQRSESCASMSIKYAFLISHFLYELKQKNGDVQDLIDVNKPELLKQVFQISNQWFEYFLVNIQKVLLKKYEALDKNILTLF